MAIFSLLFFISSSGSTVCLIHKFRYFHLRDRATDKRTDTIRSKETITRRRKTNRSLSS